MNKTPQPVWIFALVIALITSLPYAVGVLNAPDDGQYSGAAALPGGAQVDFNSHMAKLWQGSRGQLNYELLFTHEEHSALPTVQGFYVVLGTVGAILPLNMAMIYHIARFLLTIGVVLAMWRFACRFFEKPMERWLALFFGVLVNGWSWLLFFIAPEMTQQVAPIEFWLMDAWNLMGAFYMPHFSAAIILQITAFLIYDAWIHRKGNATQQITLLTLILLADAIIQPYVVLLTFPLFGIMTLYHIWKTGGFTFQRALWLIIPAGTHGGIVIYQFLAISGDPIWANFTAQNITASPPPIYYLLGYLPLLLPILFGWRKIRDAVRNDSIWLLPLLWVVIVTLLLYAPFPTQRRYLLGVQTPLAVLATIGFSRVWLRRLSSRLRPLISVGYIGFASVATLLVILSNSTALANPQNNPDLFYSADELAGYQWLRENTSIDALILTTLDPTGSGSGGRLVAMAGRRVFIGHWIETANFTGKINQLRQFYNPETDDDWRQSFLTEINADYIWYDRYAMDFGGWSPDEAGYLDAVFASDTVTVYQVTHSSD